MIVMPQIGRKLAHKRARKITIVVPLPVGPAPVDYYQMCIAWSEEDGAFVASMPELPGCMADGQTQAEGLGSLREVAALWIETARQRGREIPQPCHRSI